MAETIDMLALRITKGLVASGSQARLPTQRDVAELEQGMTRWLSSRFPGIGAAARSEYAAEAVQRFMIAASRGKVRTGALGEPGAYLRQIARNLAVDEAKSPRARVEPLEEADAATTDDALLRLFDRAATRTRIVEGIRRSWDADDGTAVRVMMGWMRLAEAEGGTPSARAVATSLEMSHTAVNDALERFRRRL